MSRRVDNSGRYHSLNRPFDESNKSDIVQVSIPNIAIQDEIGTTISANLTITGILKTKSVPYHNNTILVTQAHFLGIPYGTADIWKEPHLPKISQFDSISTSQLAYEATTFPVPCQNGILINNEDQASSKNCLKLSIYTPLTKFPSDAELLPVVIFFTGSCFMGGGGTKGGDFVARSSVFTDRNNSIVYVTMNNRAGILGYMGARVLKEIGPGANFALLDTRMVLHWVQKYISAFGGDPSRVTIYGQSSGACLSSGHYLAPKSQGLFSRAQFDSGGFNAWCTGSMFQSEQMLIKSYNRACSSWWRPWNNCDCNLNDDDLAKQRCMRDWIMTHSELEIMSLMQAKSVCRTGCAYSLVVDGVEFQKSMPELVKDVNFEQYVPVLHGTMLDDGYLFFKGKRSNIQDEAGFKKYFEWAFRQTKDAFGPSEKPKIISQKEWNTTITKAQEDYKPDNSSRFNYLFTPMSQLTSELPLMKWQSTLLAVNTSNWFVAAERAYTDWEYQCPTDWASRALSAKGPVYEFTYVYHNQDHPFVLHSAELLPIGLSGGSLFSTSDEAQQLAIRMIRFLTSFYYFGNPNKGREKQYYWKKFNASLNNLEEVGISFAFGIAEDFGRNQAVDRITRCELFQKYWDLLFTCLEPNDKPTSISVD